MESEPSSLSEDELCERLERLPYNGCALQAADLGGLNDYRVAEVMGLTRHGVELLSITATKSFRARARLRRLDFL